MNYGMDSFRTVIERWQPHPVPTLAREIGAPPETVKKWLQRDRIPAFWWPRVVEAARERDIDLSLEKLAALEAQRREAG